MAMPITPPSGNLDRLVVASGAVQRGIEDGTHNLPPATASEPTESEGAIRQVFHEWGSATISAFREKLVRPLAEATALVPIVTGEAIREMPETVAKRIADIIALEENALAPLAINASALQRTAKGVAITARAAKPEDASAWRRDVALLGATILAESLINAWAFAAGSSAGLIGGAAQALTISVTNVLGAWSLGRVARAIHDWDSQTAKYASYGVLLLGAIALGAYHVTIAAWRDLLLRATHPVHAGQFVFQFLANAGPGGIADISSWMLAGIGLGFGFWAALSGWRHIDIGAKAVAGRALRAAAIAKAVVNTRKGVLLGSVGTIHDDAREHIDVLVADVRDALAKLYALVNTIQADADDLATQLTRLNEAYVLAIAKYRTTNSRVRSAPVPCYFAAAPTPLAIAQPFDKKILALAKAADDGIFPLANIAQKVDEARRAIDQARPLHIAAVQALINRIDRLAAGNDALREVPTSAPVIFLPQPQFRPS